MVPLSFFQPDSLSPHRPTLPFQLTFPLSYPFIPANQPTFYSSILTIYPFYFSFHISFLLFFLPSFVCSFFLCPLFPPALPALPRKPALLLCSLPTHHLPFLPILPLSTQTWGHSEHFPHVYSLHSKHLSFHLASFLPTHPASLHASFLLTCPFFSSFSPSTQTASSHSSHLFLLLCHPFLPCFIQSFPPLPSSPILPSSIVRSLGNKVQISAPRGYRLSVYPLLLTTPPHSRSGQRSESSRFPSHLHHFLAVYPGTLLNSCEFCFIYFLKIR